MQFSCAQLYYDVKAPIEAKTPAFGIGSRFGTHMILQTDAPSPQLYTLPSPDDKKGFHFGISREKYDKVYIKEHLR